MQSKQIEAMKFIMVRWLGVERSQISSNAVWVFKQCLEKEAEFLLQGQETRYRIKDKLLNM